MHNKVLIGVLAFLLSIALGKVLVATTFGVAHALPSYEQTPQFFLSMLLDADLVRKFVTASFYIGGIGGICGFAFTIGGAGLMIRGEGTLEIGLAMLICMLIFFFAFQAGHESRERRYNFDKYWNGRQTIFDHDPTLDYDAKRPPEDPNAAIKSQYVDYNPKDTAERYRNM